MNHIVKSTEKYTLVKNRKNYVTYIYTKNDFIQQDIVFNNERKISGYFPITFAIVQYIGGICVILQEKTPYMVADWVKQP